MSKELVRPEGSRVNEILKELLLLLFVDWLLEVMCLIEHAEFVH